MAENGWIDVSISPIESGIPPDAVILVWHTFQGVMTVLCESWNKNRFYTHWQKINHGAWVKTADKMPEKTDADALNCVIARAGKKEIRMEGWHNFRGASRFREWQTPPEAPDNYRKDQRNALQEATWETN